MIATHRVLFAMWQCLIHTWLSPTRVASDFGHICVHKGSPLVFIH